MANPYTELSFADGGVDVTNPFSELSFAEEDGSRPDGGRPDGGLTDEQLPWIPEVIAALMCDAEFFQCVLEAYQEIYCEEMGDGEEESES